MRNKIKKDHEEIAPLIYEGAGDLVLSAVLISFCELHGISKNDIRIANKRFLAVMDDAATSITWTQPRAIFAGHMRVYPHNLSMFAFFPGRWPNLHTINCSGNSNFASLQGIPTTIQFLSIANCSLVHSLAPLAACTLLKELDCSGTSVSNLSYLTACTMLEVLDISSCSCLPSNCLQPLTVLRSLRELNCRNTPVPPHDVQDDEDTLDLTPLASFESLSKLHLRTSINDLSPVAAIANLSVLDLSGCSGELGLSSLASCAHLRHLSLKETDFVDLGSLSSCPQLSSVDLKDTDFSLSDLISLASNPHMKKIQAEFDDSLIDEMAVEDLFNLLALKSPCINSLIPYLLEAIMSSEELTAEISDIIKVILTSENSGHESVLTAVDLLYKLLDASLSSEVDLNTSEVTKAFFPSEIFLPLVKTFVSSDGDVRIVHLLFNLIEEHLGESNSVADLDEALVFSADDEPNKPAIVPFLVPFISPGHDMEVRKASATILATISAAHNIYFEYEYEDEEETRAKMNSIRSFVLSQPGILDSLMDMISLGNEKLHYRGYKLLQNLAGDHDYCTYKVWRTDVTSYHENAAFMAAHPGLLTLLYNLVDHAIAMKKSEDDEAFSLLGILGSHDKDLAKEVVKRMKSLLIAHNPNPDLPSVIWKLDSKGMVLWITELLSGNKQKDHDLVETLLQELGESVKEVMESEIPRLLVANLKKKKNTQAACSTIEAISSLLGADSRNADNASKLAALPGDLISLLISCAESKSVKVQAAAVQALDYLSLAKTIRAKIFQANQPKSGKPLIRFLASLLDKESPQQSEAEAEVLTHSLFLLENLAEGNKKRTNVIGNIPNFLDRLLSTTTISERKIRLLEVLASDEKLAVKIVSHNVFLESLCSELEPLHSPKFIQHYAVRLLVALSLVDGCRFIMWSLYRFKSGLHSILCGNHSQKMHVAKILTNLAGNSVVKKELKHHYLVDILVDIQNKASDDEYHGLKKAVSQALKKIRSR